MILRLSDIFVLDLSPLVLALSDDRVSNCQEKYMYKLDSFIDLFFLNKCFFPLNFFSDIHISIPVGNKEEECDAQ